MSKFKDGDRVRVVNIIGFEAIKDMADSVGKVGTYKLGEDEIIKVTFNDGSYWHYLKENIELVSKSTPILNDTKGLLQALMDGYVIQDIGFNYSLQCIDGKLVGNTFLLKEPIDKLQIKLPEVPWYDNIPDSGLLCWVDMEEEGDIFHRCCAIITNYLPKSRYSYITWNNMSWKRAIPFTHEDVLKYTIQE
jgi:hypothetical protein